MARHYASKDFFWCMPNALLARYFQGKPMVGELDFAAMSATQHGDFFPLGWPCLIPSATLWTPSSATSSI